MTRTEREEELDLQLSEAAQKLGAIKAAKAVCVTGTDCPGERHYLYVTEPITRHTPHFDELVGLVGANSDSLYPYFLQCLGCGRRFVQSVHDCGKEVPPIEIPKEITNDIMWNG